MKVKIKDLRPNPYRDMENYPIDEKKVIALMQSIEQTGFWDNILARKVAEEIQIAYGHHRLEALKRKYNPNFEVDIPVKDLPDYVMLQIMANENKEDWKLSPIVLLETIKAAKEFLDNELAKYDTLEELKLGGEFLPKLFTNQQSFSAAKREDMGGVGADTIRAFLGEGSWSPYYIKEGLKNLKRIKDGTLNMEAVKELDSVSNLEYFSKNVVDVKLSDEEQVEFAKEMKDEKTARRQVDDFFFEKQYRGKPKAKKKAIKLIEFEDFVRDITNRADAFILGIEDLIKYKDEFNSETYRKMIGKYVLIMKLNRMSDLITNFLNVNSNGGNTTVSRKELPKGSI